MARFFKRAPSLSYKRVVERLGIKILPPEENDNFMKDVVGLAEPKKYLSQTLELLKNPDKPENQMATLNRKFVFVGNTGVGKALMAYAFAKEANLPIIVIEAEKFVNEKYFSLIEGFKLVLDQHQPSVVLLKDIEYTTQLDTEKTISLLSTLTDYLNSYTDCIFITTISSAVILPEFILSEKGFNLNLTFENPDLPQREILIQRSINRFPHDKNLDISKIAKNTLGMTGGTIYKLLCSSYNQALMDGKTEIDFESIDIVLSSNLYGYRKKLMTEKERRLTAYHEAGHVIAGYFSDPDYKLSKVEIVHRSESLGLTISETDEDKYTYLSGDYENRIIMCYGGMAAEDLMLGSHSSGVSGDLETATEIAEAMIKRYGMSKEFGPVSIGNDIEQDFVSDVLDKKAGEIIQKFLKSLQERTDELMLKYKDALVALSEALLEKETLYSDEISEILSKYDDRT